MPAKTSVYVLLLTIALLGTSARADSEMAAFIRAEVEQIRYAHEYKIGPIHVAGRDLVAAFYEQRGFAPAWGRQAQVDGLMEAIRRIEADGLDPKDYYLSELLDYHQKIAAADIADGQLKAEFDLILTGSLIRLCYNLIFGKVDPITQHASWNFNRDVADLEPVAFLEQAIASDDIAVFIAELIPKYRIYTGLKGVLADYRRMAAAGGWAPIPEGDTLKQGMQDERVAALRQRLVAGGDLLPGQASGNRFDEALEATVKRFQQRHSLDADGVVGQGTLAALNVSAEQRIGQIRVNLERLRWVLHDVPPEFILVDIAGYRVYVYKERQTIWESRVQVGRPYRQTPSFRSDMKYIVFNPTWTVPPGILSKDVLPAIKKDPGYLERRNISVLDRSGRPVDTGAIDWAKTTARRFPYILRQEPGPSNALGQVKFIFPNKHFVFLHDTPSKALFRRTDRAFSSGCIRVERPLELAALLLQDVSGWNRSHIDKLIAAGRTQTVFLSQPVPVLMVYLTAEFFDGQILFKDDVYKRDAPLRKALDSPFRFHEAS
ncbi:MAG: L,D-transpeptidase family protein [Desulfobacterales bacterium]|nr:L,D-transpeptidase family protein [Desulfobacterales bacterium]MDJ0882948.1 L,D-transpeptidase family protein [Desulfobacterales bacterium]